jgi:hypothetical protein
MLIPSLLIGAGAIGLFCALLQLLPLEGKISEARRSFEESSKQRDKYLERMRRNRFENFAANELREQR